MPKHHDFQNHGDLKVEVIVDSLLRKENAVQCSEIGNEKKAHYLIQGAEKLKWLYCFMVILLMG